MPRPAHNRVAGRFAGREIGSREAECRASSAGPVREICQSCVASRHRRLSTQPQENVLAVARDILARVAVSTAMATRS